MPLDVARLAHWLGTWIGPDGAVHGFHNHSVWGGNPYRVGDFTAGHQTWASPLIAALADAAAQQPDPRAAALVERLIAFQTESFQSDGQYAHIGFQLGELADQGLIHNAIANVSLGLVLAHGASILGETDRDRIRRAVERNTICHHRAEPHGCCNQEYARVWAQLLFERAFGPGSLGAAPVADLDALAEAFHVPGIPDDDCAGALRSAAGPGFLEPAEYYGLMIRPLLLAYEVYGEKRLLERAGALCRHVARSGWRDARGCMRLHRLWHRARGAWRLSREPMLIAGMGDTLSGIAGYLAHADDPELADFLDACEDTLAHYQTPRGFFVSATGWRNEADIAPSTAWHAHDLAHLIRRHGPPAGFWDRVFAPDDAETTDVLLGEEAIWIERGAHWSISSYATADLYALVGRKDHAVFARQLPPLCARAPATPDALRFEGRPTFFRDEGAIFLWRGDERTLRVTCAAEAPYAGRP